VVAGRRFAFTHVAAMTPGVSRGKRATSRSAMSTSEGFSPILRAALATSPQAFGVARLGRVQNRHGSAGCGGAEGCAQCSALAACASRPAENPQASALDRCCRADDLIENLDLVVGEGRSSEWVT